MANPNSISSLSLTTINTLTNPKVAQKIADNITARIPLLHFLNKMGHKEYESGGRQYWLPVFKELQTGTAYTGATVFGDTVEADPVTTAIYERKHLTWAITVSGTNLLKNSGSDDTAIVNYLETLIETAQESAKNDMAGTSIGIMSDEADSDLGITGLQTYLTTSATTGTVGTLSRATYSFWRHQLGTTITAFATNGLTSMRSLFVLLTRGDEIPTVVTMTASGFANLLTALTGTINYDYRGKEPTVGDVDFPTINFHGATVLADGFQPANTLYMLNLKYFKLLVHADRDMTIRDFIAPTNQDILVGRLYWAGNLVCNNLNRQGRTSGGDS